MATVLQPFQRDTRLADIAVCDCAPYPSNGQARIQPLSTVEIVKRGVVILVEKRADVAADTEYFGVVPAQAYCPAGMLLCDSGCGREILRPALAKVQHLPKSRPRRSHCIVGLQVERLIEEDAGFVEFVTFHAVD